MSYTLLCCEGNIFLLQRSLEMCDFVLDGLVMTVILLLVSFLLLMMVLEWLFFFFFFFFFCCLDAFFTLERYMVMKCVFFLAGSVLECFGYCDGLEMGQCPKKLMVHIVSCNGICNLCV